MRLCAYLAPLCLLASTLLTGCSVAFNPAPGEDATVQTPIGNISGSTYGGRQPVTGAKIYLFAAGTTAYGGPGIAASTSNASTSLLNSTVPAVCTSAGAQGGTLPCKDSSGNYFIFTDSGGYFNIGGEYTCTSGQQVYMYTIGGNGGGGTNAAASLMAALGNCPSTGTLAQQTPYVYMNEVTTVAAAYAFAGFASDALHVSTSGSALAKVGIKNAFANAFQMANISTPSNPSSSSTDYGGALAATPSGTITSIAQTGAATTYTVAPTVTLAASPNGATATATAAVNSGNLTFTITNAGSGYQVTPIVTLTGGTYTGSPASAGAVLGTGNGVVPQKLINSIANVLATCVNSNGSTTACTTLFNDDRSGGGQTGTQPAETATAAIYLAQHPYSAYVGTIFALASPTSVPFTPALTSAPTTFIVELIFTGGNLNNGNQVTYGTYWPQNTAVDASGNIWVANDASNSVSKFSPLGVPLTATTGFTDSFCGITGAPTTNSLPSAIAIANTGYAWVGIDRAGKVCVLSSTGTHLASVTVGTTDPEGNGTNYLDGPFGIALDSTGNAWVTMDATDDQGGTGSATTAGQLVQINGTTYTATTKATGITAGMNGPVGIAIQSPTTFGTGHTGDIWAANYAGNLNPSNGYDSVFTSAGAAQSFSSAGVSAGSIDYPVGVAIDANGYVWSTDVGENLPDGVSKTKYDGTTGTYYSLSGASPAVSIAIDGADNVWIASMGSGSGITGDILEVTNNGALLSPAAGFVPATDTGSNFTPDNVVIDGSGNVWFPIQGNTLREFIGAATPVATPLAYGVANNLLGSRP